MELVHLLMAPGMEAPDVACEKKKEGAGVMEA
jgi:hypothetical protein